MKGCFWRVPALADCPAKLPFAILIGHSDGICVNLRHPSSGSLALACQARQRLSSASASAGAMFFATG